MRAGFGMPNRNAFRLVGAAAAVGLAVISSASLAADDKKACSEAYEKTQSLRQDGKLGAAHEQALVCVRDVCAEFMRTDCTRWLDEIETISPSVVLRVRDAAGRDVTDVSVSLDGRPWLSELDGKTKPIDPGPHSLELRRAGAAPVTQTVRIREGEKAREITVSLGAEVAPTEGRSTSSKPEPAPGPAPASGSRSPAPWILGSVGVAGLAVGSILGAVVLNAKSTFDKNCTVSGSTGVCKQDGLDAASTVRSLGPATTVALVAGGALTATAVVWLVVRKPSPTGAAVGLAAYTSGAASGIRLRGTF
jgi:hypothetical protein